MDPEMDLVMGPETGPDMDEPRRRGGGRRDSVPGTGRENRSVTGMIRSVGRCEPA